MSDLLGHNASQISAKHSSQPSNPNLSDSSLTVPTPQISENSSHSINQVADGSRPKNFESKNNSSGSIYKRNAEE